MELEVQNEQQIQPANSDPGVMLAEAIKAGHNVETIRVLSELFEKFRDDQRRREFYAAMSAFQANMPSIPKQKEVKDKSGKVRYRYAPLDAIVDAVKPSLEKYGLTYTLKPDQDDGPQFTARLAVRHVNGYEEETSFTVPIDTDSYMSAPQKVGAARTFALRYAFCNAFGILTSDEDTDAATFDDGVKYADYIHALEAETDLESLRKSGKSAHDKLKAEGDEHGAQVIMQVYNRRKGELS